MSAPLPGPRPGPRPAPSAPDIGAEDPFESSDEIEHPAQPATLDGEEADLELDAVYAGLIPDPRELEELPTRDHVALFEEIQNRLAEHLDDSEG